MAITPQLRKIIDGYEADTPGCKANLVRMLNHGRLAGTGRLVVLPVEQGFEHGPARAYAPNPEAYDPHYHFSIAIEAGLSAYAAPLGMIEAGADSFAGQIPTILKLNGADGLATGKELATTGSVADALRLGCSGIGFTIHPGSAHGAAQMEQIRALAAQARAAGLVVAIWSHPRGPEIDRAGETAIDVCAYAAHVAAVLGAHIVKVHAPSDHLSLQAAKKVYEAQQIDVSTMAKRVAHVVQACFDGRRAVLFSCGDGVGDEQLLETARGVHRGGGAGVMLGRSSFQRPRQEALSLLRGIVSIFNEPGPR